MLVITEKEVESLLVMDDAIGVVEDAYRFYNDGKIVSFPRTGGALNDSQGAYIILPASHMGKGYFGFKYAGSCPANPALGIPTVASCILLCSAETGFPIAFMGANYITAVKTGSSPAVATKYMARKNASAVAIIGAGFQASYQLKGLSCVRDIKKLRIYDKNRDASEKLARWYVDNIGDVDVMIAGSSDEAAMDADIITTITTSFTPVLSDAVACGTHINAMGSFTPEMQEISADVVASASAIATDVPEDMWLVAGDLIGAVNEGKLRADNPVLDMGSLVSGKVVARTDDDDITLFESVGFSALDVAVAIHVFEKATERGTSTDISVF